MQDEYSTQPRTRAPRSGVARTVVAVGLLAFMLGAVLAGWIAWRSGLTLGHVLGTERPGASAPAASPGAAVAGMPLAANPVLARGAMEQRIAALEQRLALLDLQAQAVSGNTARAEALLVAFAVRRMIERGSPLGYLEDQLRVRFGDSQPNAVATITAAARRPVTLDQLTAQLKAMTPALVKTPQDESGWRRVTREVSDLFVIRSEDRPAQNPSDRVERAQLLLRQGQVAAAIMEVRQLPNSAAAANWLAAAQRHLAAQRALDLIESTALIATDRLGDSNGQQVQTPSPLTAPTPAPAT